MMRCLFLVLMLILGVASVQAQYVDRTKVTEAVAATATLQSAATANGDGATLDVSGYSSVSFVVTGTFTATVNFEATGDDTNWVALQALQIGTSTISTSTSTAATFSAAIGSLKTVRARISGYASGSVTVAARANLAQGATPQVVTGSVTTQSNASTNLAQIAGSSIATAATGIQKVGVTDSSGNAVTSTGNALDINIKSGNPTTITATQGTATNLKTQAESYQGGTAVGSGNPLQVSLANTGANATAVKVDNSAVTQPVSAASLPLPTDAATSTAQTDGSQKTRVTDGTNDAAVKAASTAAVAADKALVVAVSPNNTIPISAASLPLPSTAATSTKQSDGSQKTQVVDGSGNVIGSTSNALDINIKSGNPTTIIATQSSGSNLNTDANLKFVGGNAALTGNGISGSGALRVTIASDSTGTLAATQSGTWITQPVPGTANGASTCVVQSAASTNATNCKNAAGLLYGVEVVNTTSTLYYLRLYNLSTSPTCSSATGFIRTVPIPHASGAGAGIANFYTVGETYGTGIGFCLTGGGSSTDNTNAATGVYVTLHYK